MLQKHNSDPSLPGSEDPSDDDTVLHISGPYSQAAIKVWLDEQQSDFSDQISEYLAPAAADVMRAIGALILVVSPDHEPERLVHQIRSVSRLIEAVGGGYEWDGAQIVLHANLDTPMARELREPVEDACAEALFEFIDLAESGVNEFREKLGGERLHEVLQSVSWEENRLSDRSDAEDSLENGGRFDTDLEAFDTLLKQLSLIKGGGCMTQKCSLSQTTRPQFLWQSGAR